MNNENNNNLQNPINDINPTPNVSAPVPPVEPTPNVSAPVPPVEPTPNVGTPVPPVEPTPNVGAPVPPVEPTLNVSAPVPPVEPAPNVGAPVPPINSNNGNLKIKSLFQKIKPIYILIGAVAVILIGIVLFLSSGFGGYTKIANNYCTAMSG